MHTESTALTCSDKAHSERVTRADPGLPGWGHGGPSGGQREPARRHGKRSAALRVVPGHRHSPGRNWAHSVTCERNCLLCTRPGLSPLPCRSPMSRSLTIIGSGMAGLGLLKQLRALGDTRRVTLISADSGADYSKPLLSSSFAKGLAPERLAMRSALEVSDQLNAVVRTHTRVDRLDPLERCLWIGEERLVYDELVLATGAAPRTPFTLPAGVAKRVFSVNDLDDFRAFHAALGALNGSARVMIIGAGLVGCEFANDLSAAGHRVSLVAPESTPLPRLLPEPLGHVLGELFNAGGIELHLDRMLERVTEAGSQVSVELDDGRSLKVDLVLLATGLRPRTELAEAAGLAVTAA